MLPQKIRNALFDRMSVRTMRYVKSIPTRKAEGLVRRVYDMVGRDFFINGSITGHSKVPELMAGFWTAGRETLLVADRLERTLKEAMGGTLSYLNDCPYCADMFVSLVHGAGEAETASGIMFENEEAIKDELTRQRLLWVRAATLRNEAEIADPPFTEDELPEAIATLFMSSYVNRFSHVVMDGSPVEPLFGSQRIKDLMLRIFGVELHVTTQQTLVPGEALDLLPEGPLPRSLAWAKSNPRIAAALSRWSGAIERETPLAVSPKVRALVEESLGRWQGDRMPISRAWVDEEVAGLAGEDRAVARLALVMAKASYHFDDSLVQDLLAFGADEPKLIRILAWASFLGARRLAECTAESINLNPVVDKVAA
jgi:hypothetical protein